jgi:hypothetical protein
LELRASASPVSPSAGLTAVVAAGGTDCADAFGHQAASVIAMTAALRFRRSVLHARGALEPSRSIARMIPPATTVLTARAGFAYSAIVPRRASMEIFLDKRAVKQIRLSAQDAIEEGDTETLREDILEAFTEEQVEEIERRLDNGDFFEFLTDMLDEWSGDDVEELFELIDTQLGDVGIDVKFEKKAAVVEDDEDEAKVEEEDLGEDDDLDEDEDLDDEEEEEEEEEPGAS